MNPRLRLVFLAGLVWAAVSLDMGVISFSLKPILSEYAVSKAMKSLLASSTLVGMLVGASSSGHLGDRVGRKRAAVYFIALHVAATVLGSLSPSPEALVLDRVLVGIGLGGVLPLVSSLVAEYSPPRERGRNVALLESFWAYGWLAAVLVAWALVPGHGWRVYMAAAGSLAALFSLAAWGLDESPRFLLAVGKRDEAERLAARYGAPLPRVSRARLTIAQQLRMLLAGDAWRVTLPLWIVWFTITMGYYGIFIWFPALVAKSGAELGLASVSSFISSHYYGFLALVTLFQIPGYYSSVLLVDRVGRKPILSGYLLGVAVASYFYSRAGSLAAFLAWSLVLNFFDLGAWAALYVYTPEQYPTQIRGTGSGWAAAWGRLGGITGPYLVPYLGGWSSVFGFFAAVHLVGVIAAALGREMKGIEMPEI